MATVSQRFDIRNAPTALWKNGGTAWSLCAGRLAPAWTTSDASVA